MSQLFVPSEGPCAGHPCDNCKICQSGRCCRNDNPNYRLPDVGEWDGPIYGEIGVLADDGAKVECHACGQLYSHLGSHVWHTHNLTGDEYRAIFGLSRTCRLAGRDMRNRTSVATKSNPETMKRINKLRDEDSRRVTPEQNYARLAKPMRLQTLNTLKMNGLRGREGGRPNGMDQLTNDVILTIAEKAVTGRSRYQDIATEFDISIRMVRRIVEAYRLIGKLRSGSNEVAA